jgi:hypothetical protein
VVELMPRAQPLPCDGRILSALTQAAFAQPNLPFPYRAGMFDGEAPGAVSSQQTPIATPGLVTE